MQRLVAEHQAELKRAEARHEAAAGSVMQAAIAQHEEQLAAVQAAAAAERAAAADAERAAAREQVKDAQSRWVDCLLAVKPATCWVRVSLLTIFAELT
jgi:leucyl aminopeptidase (aminopeptidase T)